MQLMRAERLAAGAGRERYRAKLECLRTLTQR